MRAVPYVAWDKVGQSKNAVADGGSLLPNTKVMISHTKAVRHLVPQQFRADTSTEIAINYVASPEGLKLLEEIDCVTNDHYDIDGLLSVFVLTDPAFSLEHRYLIEQASRAGDFLACKDEAATKITFALLTLEDSLRASFAEPNNFPAVTEFLYIQLLKIFPDLLLHYQSTENEKLWRKQWDHYVATECSIESGDIEIKLIPEEDLAIATLSPKVDFDTQLQMKQPIYNRSSRCYTPLFIQPSTSLYLLGFRYEEYVALQTDELPAWVPLQALIDELNELEKNGKWAEVGPSYALTLALGAPSSIDAQEWVQIVRRYLKKYRQAAL